MVGSKLKSKKRKIFWNFFLAILDERAHKNLNLFETREKSCKKVQFLRKFSIQQSHFLLFPVYSINILLTFRSYFSAHSFQIARKHTEKLFFLFMELSLRPTNVCGVIKAHQV